MVNFIMRSLDQLYGNVDYRIPFGGYKLFEIGHELGEYAHDILSPSGISM